MEAFYLAVVIFLFILAVFDLVVGVSNDAVNFLNSAIGSRVASFRTIMVIAAAGILVGASLSNGMMDIARHGIYQPQHFYFQEIMYILLAVMLTDVVLLDVFNSLGMPTSTTVSLVFELLGGTFALAIFKIAADETLSFGTLLNTDKALTVILAIFISVAVAFFFGMVVQYLSRLLFTFNYKRKMKYFVGIFGGLAITAIIYFMLIKGLKDSSFMTNGLKRELLGNTGIVVLVCLGFFTVLMQLLHWLKVNVFKIVILSGTFALALAFAGNDLVNFIGVPLVGYSSYMDFVSQEASPDGLLMSSLLAPARTPWFFLVGAGLIMAVALFMSKKAQNVVKTSLDLSRQREGEENFGTSPVARVLVRVSGNMVASVDRVVPGRVRQWIGSRFDRDDVIMESGAAFDQVRASVNVVLAGLLIALGTSLKLPLSTTYVAFMVAMGSSLADRAWGRESAVYRITGVLSVIGGWFLTAGVAFFICFTATMIIYFGGTIAIAALILLAVYSLIRSQLLYKKKVKKQEADPTITKLMATHDTDAALSLLREHTREEAGKVLQFAGQTYMNVIQSFMGGSYRGLRKEMNQLEEEKKFLKRMKRQGVLATCKLDPNVATGKGLYYYQGNDFMSEITYSISRICAPCLEHTDNNFTPLDREQKTEFMVLAEEVGSFIGYCGEMVVENDYGHFEEAVARTPLLVAKLADLRVHELTRIQSRTSSLNVSMVYLNMIHETQNVVSYTTNLLKVSRKFQQDE